MLSSHLISPIDGAQGIQCKNWTLQSGKDKLQMLWSTQWFYGHTSTFFFLPCWQVTILMRSWPWNVGDLSTWASLCRCLYLHEGNSRRAWPCTECHPGPLSPHRGTAGSARLAGRGFFLLSCSHTSELTLNCSVCSVFIETGIYNNLMTITLLM